MSGPKSNLWSASSCKGNIFPFAILFPRQIQVILFSAALANIDSLLQFSFDIMLFIVCSSRHQCIDYITVGSLHLSPDVFLLQEKLAKSIHYLISKEDQVRTQISDLDVLIKQTEVRDC